MKRNKRSRQKLSPATEEEDDQKGAVSRSGRRKKTDHYWYQKRLETLSLHFNPIVFPPPGKPLDVGAHEALLRRLGLWDFVNLDFDDTIREDLVEELVLCYKPTGKSSYGRSRVNSVGISLNRTALGKVLRLPTVRVSKVGEFSVSKEEALFLEELIWGFLVLRDKDEDGSFMSHPFMLGFAEAVRERRFESIDWAGLVWFMVEREVNKGINLAKSYYAPHLQLVLKHNRPEWFGDADGASAGSKSRQNSILTKCCKRKREDFEEDDEEGERSRKMVLAGRKIWDDLSAVCQSDMVELDNGEKLFLNLQVNSNAGIRSSGCDVSVAQPYNPSESSIEITEPKGAHTNDYEIYEGKENMQVQDLQSVLVEESTNQGVMVNLDSREWKLARCRKENDVSCEGMETEVDHHEDQSDMFDGGATGAESEVSFANKVHGKETSIVVEKKPQRSAPEGKIINSLDEVPCIKEGDEEEGKANQAECETITLNAFEVQRDKKDNEGVLDEAEHGASEEEKGKGSAPESNIIDSLDEVPCMKEGDETEGKADEAECETITLNPFEVKSDKEYNEGVLDEAEHGASGEEKAKGSAHESNIIESLGEVVPCMKEGDEIEGKADEAKFETITLNAFEVKSDEEDNEGVLDEAEHGASGEEKAKGSAPESNIIDSLDEVPCMKEADEAEFETNTLNNFEVQIDKEDNAAVHETSTDNALKDHSLKENYAVQDKENEAASEANAGDSTDVLCVKEHAIEDKENETIICDSLKEQVCVAQEFAAKKNRDSMDDFSGFEIDCQEVDMNWMEDNAGREIKSVSFLDLLMAQEAHGEVVKKDSSTDGLDQQEIKNLQKRVDIIENENGHELEFKTATEMCGDSIADVQEVDLNCLEHNSGREVESMTFVDLLLAQETHGEVLKKDSSPDGLDQQEIENLQKRVDIIENKCRPELEFKSAIEMCRDSIPDVAGDEMDCQEDLNCMEDKAGKEVEYVNFFDLLMAQEAPDGVVNNEGSFDVSNAQRIDEHWSPQNMANEAVCETSTGIELEVYCLKEDDAMADETSYGNALDVQCMKGDYVVPDVPSEAYVGDSFIGPCKARHEFVKDEEENETAFEANIGKSVNMHCEKEDDVMEIMECEAAPEANDCNPLSVCCFKEDVMKDEANVNDSFTEKVNMAQIDLSSSSSDEERQNAFEGFERGERRGMNGQFPFNTDMDGCNIGLAAQYGHGEDADIQKSWDLDYCAEKVNVWMSRCIDSVKKQVEESHNSNVLLQKRVEEQNVLIRKYELKLHEEQQKNRQYELTVQEEQQQMETRERKYKHELYLMNSALEDYRMAAKQLNASFAEYIEGSQLPQESLYMDHPDGGGRVVLVSEWEREQQKKSLLAIKAMLEDFEKEWKSQQEEKLGILESYCDRIGNLEHGIKTMSGRS